MTWNSVLNAVPETVVEALDAINTRVGWPRQRPDPCAGHMVSQHEPVDGIDVSIDSTSVEVRVAGITVGVGARWQAIGNAYVFCLLPHTSALESPYLTGLYQGGAINAFQHHLLVSHGTHRYDCSSLAPRDRWCRICRGDTDA
ncbi:hypothetical protein ACFLIM_38765 [Nonomuraea sp. M3C6]|uniref:Uncharacterized protein n=1 Tax=Nonomuraea marmarensis TaxID=3351344 RepID=A0ABW7ARX0_9ACTN